MTNPKGVMLYEAHLNKDESLLKIPKGIDFVLTPALVRNAAVVGFNKHVQEAYDANIPCIAMVDVDPTVYSDMFGLEDAVFPTADKDPYIAILDKLFLTPAKTSIYAIHAIMLDARTSDNKISGGWIVAATENLKSLCKERYFNIPVFILTHPEVLTLYPNSNADPQVYFSTCKKLCTQYLVSPISVEGQLVKEPTGTPSPNWNGISFWWYGSQSFDFLSGTSYQRAPILNFYAGDITQMYTALKYTPRVISEEPEEPTTPPEEPTTPPDGEVTSKTDELLQEILKALKDILAYISRP